MFPHDHPWLDEEPELMNQEQLKMQKKLDEVIQECYKKGKKKGKQEDQDGKEEAEGENAEEKKKEGDEHDKKLIDKIHAFMFVYDASNKRTFDSLMCMVDVIMQLEKNFTKGQQPKANELPQYLPKKIVVGNKKDLMKNRAAGVIGDKDIKQLDGILIKEVSSLTNQNVNSVFKKLVEQLNDDRTLNKSNEEYADKLEQVMKGAAKAEGSEE